MALNDNAEHTLERAAAGQDTQGTGTSELPEEYKGKTADELAKVLIDKEKFIQQRNQEIGDLRKRNDDLDAVRNEMAFLREQVGGMRGGQTGFRQEPSTNEMENDDVSDTDILSSPKKSVERLVARERQKWDADLERREQVRYRSDSEGAFLEGQAAFARQFPELFKGIEKDVSNVIFAGQQKRAISPSDARNIETWRTTAEWIHFRKGNRDLLLGKQAGTVKPVETQKPSRAKPEEFEDEENTDVDLTDMKVHSVMRQFGIKSVEEAKEIIKAEQKRVRKGENIPRGRK